jgi:hypothetical protein
LKNTNRSPHRGSWPGRLATRIESPSKHLVEIEYTDGVGTETDQVRWEVEPATDVLEPAALPWVEATPPMEPREFDAMVPAAHWSALTPSLPFSGLTEDRPSLAAPLFGAIHADAYHLVPVLRALEMPRVALMLADTVGLQAVRRARASRLRGVPRIPRRVPRCCRVSAAARSPALFTSRRSSLRGSPSRSACIANCV